MKRILEMASFITVIEDDIGGGTVSCDKILIMI